MFNKSARLEPLYDMDQDLDGDEGGRLGRERTRNVHDVEAKA